MIFLATLGALAGLTLFFGMLTPGPGGAMRTGMDPSGRAQVVLDQGRSGHYVAEGRINGQSVVFLVDTGATDVAVSETEARRLGLDFGPRVTVMTAAGPAPAWVTRLDAVEIGGLRAENVRASITPGLGSQALLGMSFLKQFSLRQEDGTLVIATPGTGS
jgi:aspartyl protease family protein